ncbi:MAG: alpha/beta hydrolase, partial [Vicinamibacteria bacterium]|nr:alpha/beta hydrolase [Vicinamibacteria bacterium]
CSTRRGDSCPQAHQFAAKARSLNVKIAVLGKDLSHKDINERLGEESNYTAEVESFLARLDKTVAQTLKGNRTKRSTP